MVNSLTRQLVFRLGETGFLVDLDRVVEICEQVAESFDPSHADEVHGIVGALRFRQAQVPVVDPAIHLGIKKQNSLSDMSALIIRGDEGSWALLADRVDGIVPAEKLKTCLIPRLLQSAVKGYYSHVSLLANEPLIHLDTELLYGSVAVGI